MEEEKKREFPKQVRAFAPYCDRSNPAIEYARKRGILNLCEQGLSDLEDGDMLVLRYKEILPDGINGGQIVFEMVI